jgi:hypothetical protein
MARVGQTTASGGREWALHLGLSACRRVTVPVACTVNHIGCWLREQNAVNANDVIAGIYTTGGVLLWTSSVLENDVDSTATFAEYQIPFTGASLDAGDYVLLVTASGTNGNVVMQGQNDSAGLPTYVLFDPEITFPTLPSPVTFSTDAARQWDIYLDYTESAGSSVTKTPATGNLSLGGLLATHNAFNHVRIRDVLVNESGQPIASATNITLKVWYSGYIAGPADFSRNAQTTDANGTASWSITRGSLVSGQTIFYVAQDSLSFSNYTCARMIPSYES